MVAIKDMEMPRSCKECKDKRIDHITFELCLRTGRNVVDCRDYRHCDCPLVEIEERKHGKWEQDKLFGECAYVCSFCHTIWTSSEIQNMHYCPTCGAIMRGAENE